MRDGERKSPKERRNKRERDGRNEEKPDSETETETVQSLGGGGGKGGFRGSEAPCWAAPSQGGFLGWGWGP